MVEAEEMLMLLNGHLSFDRKEGNNENMQNYFISQSRRRRIIKKGTRQRFLRSWIISCGRLEGHNYIICLYKIGTITTFVATPTQL